MKIINLIEDTEGAAGCLHEHGLSFYIETAHHKVLLDTGASDAFLKNAEKKGIDLTAVDTVVISHGHYDHAGGVLAFAKQNPNAVIYMQKGAEAPFYSFKNGMEKYIGVREEIASLPQVVFLDEGLTRDRELSLFTGVKGRRLWPRGNAVLKRKVGDAFIQDDFRHEQYLVVTEGDRRVLLSGCAHSGILNILDTYREFYGGAPTDVVSGFHTVMPSYTEEDERLLGEMARELLQQKTVYYSGHCTGEYPLQVLQRIMGDRLIVFHSGDEILSTEN